MKFMGTILLILGIAAIFFLADYTEFSLEATNNFIYSIIKPIFEFLESIVSEIIDFFDYLIRVFF